MVNTGRPSSGCETCRRRRVKCDLRRPGCYRCEKLLQPCSGYRSLDSQDSVFRIQTQSSYGPRSWQKPSARHRPKSPRVDCPPENEDLSVSICSPVDSWDSHVIPLILSQFSASIPGGRASHVYISLVSPFDLLQSVESGSLLYLASHAVGSAYFANKTRSPNFTSIHQRLYGQSLRVLKEALQDSQIRKEDSTFMAVWFLGLYELIAGAPPSDGTDLDPSNWDVHSRALISFIRMRGSEQFNSKRGCQLFQLAYHSIQIQYLQTGCHPPPDAAEWFNGTKDWISTAKIIFVPLFSYCDKAARLCSNTQHLIQQFSPENVFGFILNIFEACKELEKSMQDRFREVIKYPSIVTVAESIESLMNITVGLHIQNYIDACLLRIDQSMLQLLSHLSQQPGHSTGQLEEIERLRRLTVLQSQGRADRILETVPRLLPPSISNSMGASGNWANSLRLLWPLRLVASSPFLLVRQNASAYSTLARIGYEVGIMQAVGGYLSAYQKLISTPCLRAVS